MMCRCADRAEKVLSWLGYARTEMMKRVVRLPNGEVMHYVVRETWQDQYGRVIKVTEIRKHHFTGTLRVLAWRIRDILRGGQHHDFAST
jgi:hypothetical protein